MTTITIIVLLALFGGFIGFVIMLQVKEQARLEKLRKASLLNNQARQIRRYLDDFPPQYQPKDLRLWLFSCLVSVFDELLSLQPDESLKRRRAHAAEEMQEFRDSKQKRKARAVNDELQVIELKRLFDSFDNFLNVSKEQKKIDSDSAFKYRSLLAFFRYKVSADHKGYLARQAFLMNKFDDAIGLYKQAVDELDPIKEVPEADEARKKFQGYADEIESDLLLQQQEQALLGDDEEDDTDDEWNKFIGGSEFEKKKYF
ncbi:hypothetical protein O1D97_16660 [Marinomonas sp. 15G1-11]|uniref:Uncharacterized protein n=1 Tax=Marinomonas phaeophyticola TaxID=3004091 RepID=A0ABT4JZJ8_9GAMM|nr:hypothetical protein [Marinomonas sp. 15G1-11]MCZ2723198.1 hypothetical protein [Marinomonas sp. 15G1-11]